MKFRPVNRYYYPFHIDLFDISLGMESTHIMSEDQNIVQNLFCLLPSYTGFESHVLGVESEGGHESSDQVTIGKCPRLCVSLLLLH